MKAIQVILFILVSLACSLPTKGEKKLTRYPLTSALFKDVFKGENASTVYSSTPKKEIKETPRNSEESNYLYFDFEDGTPWSQDFGTWTFVDIDESPIGGFQNHVLPGFQSGETTASFFVFDTSLDWCDQSFNAYSGTKYLATMFRYDGGVIDDWAISPLLSGESQTVSFMAKSYSAESPEKIQLFYSRKDKEISDFIQFGIPDIIVPNEWTEYSFDIPAGANYFAIRSCASDSFMLMLDDVSVESNSNQKNNYDLEVESISAPLYVPNGNTFGVTVMVRNKGLQDVDSYPGNPAYSVKLYIDDVLVSTHDMSTLLSGESASTTFHTTMSSENGGPKSVYAVVEYPTDETPDYSDLTSETIQIFVPSTKFPDLYGFVVYADGWPASDPPIGLYNVATSTPELVRRGPGTAWGNIEVDGIIYCLEYNDFIFVQEMLIKAYDSATGELIKSATAELGWLAPAGFVKDPITGNIYGISYDDNGGGFRLATFEFSPDCTVNVNEIAPIQGKWNSLVCDAAGQLYGISYETSRVQEQDIVYVAVLNKIDKYTGVVTPIGETEQLPQYVSSATIDYRSGRMFWNVVEYVGKSYLCEVNLSTGVATQLFQYTDGSEIVGMYIPDNHLPLAVVNTPSITIEHGKIEIKCDIENSTIMYTLDGSVPTNHTSETCYEYTGPFIPESDCLIRAIACKENWDHSEIAEYSFHKSEVTVPRPSIVPDYAGHKIMIDHEVNAQSVRVFTVHTDGSITEDIETTPYQKDIDPDMTNISVVALGGTELIDSDSVDFEIMFVKDPIFQFTNDKLLEIVSETFEATIFYTLDGSDPTPSSLLYMEPFSITERVSVKAYATKENYFDSFIKEFYSESYSLSAPFPTYKNKHLILSMEEELEGVKIMYTFDDIDPVYGIEYTGPIALPQQDVTVSFIATHPEKYNSAIGKYNFMASEYVARTPTVECFFEDRLIKIHHNQDDHPINIKIEKNDGSEDILTVSGAYELNVESNMVQVSVNAAETIELFPSETILTPLVFSEIPTISFDGYNLVVNLVNNEVNSSINVEINGIPTVVTAGEAIHLEETGRVVGITNSNNMFRSDPREIMIDAWFNGEKGATRVAGAFNTALQWCGNNLDSEIAIAGPLNANDFATIRQCTGIRHLDISEAIIESELPTKAFEGTDIVSINMPTTNIECEPSAFAGAFELSAIVWNAPNTPEGNAFTGMANPNALLFVSSGTVPSGVSIQVVKDEMIESLDLTDGYPFFASLSFTAGSVSFTRDFFQKTEPGEVRGWEAICLPFAPDEITHIDKGKCAPFGAEVEIANGAKPFWLYEMTNNNGFQSANFIKANTPYLISMPNNNAYADRYILGGKVTFSANDASISATPRSAQNVAEISYSRDNLGEGAFTLNVSDDPNGHRNDEMVGGDLYGSVFLQNHRALRPFEGYFTANVKNNAPRIPLVDGFSDISMPSIDGVTDGLQIIIDNGHVLLLSERDRTVVITDMTGQVISRVEVPAGVMTDAGRFAPGIYIIGNQKIMIR